MTIENILLAVVCVWLIVLSAFFVWIFNKFKNFTGDVKKGNLINILDKVLSTEKKNKKEIGKLKKELAKLEKQGFIHIQKVGLVRFNPFKEIGGDHSFCLAALNNYDDGFILTGLHTRERTRVYLKQIKKGRSNLELSVEEKRALTKAQKNK